MKRTHSFSFGLTVGLALGASTLSIPLVSPSVQAADIHFKPVVTTAPIRRVGAGTRGICPSQPRLPVDFAVRAIAPQTMGETYLAQPTLYWLVTEPITGKFNFSLEPTPPSDTLKATAPLFETTFDLSLKPGIQTISLAKYQVSLQKNVEYTWSITLVCDADNPSTNIGDNGTIKYVDPTVADWSDHVHKVSQKDPAELPYLYAENGLWYEAVGTLVDLIGRHPQDDKLRQAWRSLLKQGGITEEVALP